MNMFNGILLSIFNVFSFPNFSSFSLCFQWVLILLQNTLYPFSKRCFIKLMKTFIIITVR